MHRASGCVVLDAACGTGYAAGQLVESGAGNYLGMDISAHAVVYGQRSFDVPNIQFLVADVTNLPLPDATIDLYLSFETIEHVGDDVRYLNEAARVVRSDGLFVCSTPNRCLTNPGTTIKDRPFNPFHLREYLHDELVMRLSIRFDSVEMCGQSFYSERYVRILAKIGSWSPPVARRVHQLAKVISSLWDHRGNHIVGNQRKGYQPEIWIAVCRRPIRP